MEIPQNEVRQPAAAIPNRTPRLVAFVNRFRRNPRPTVTYDRSEDRARIIDNARDMSPPQPPIGRRVVSFLQRHKRKIAIGGGVLALGGAIVGGLSRALSKKKNKRRRLKKKKTCTKRI